MSTRLRAAKGGYKMETKDKINIMLTQLAKNEEYLLINSVRNRYKNFII
jgi:hypothetical protein